MDRPLIVPAQRKNMLYTIAVKHATDEMAAARKVPKLQKVESILDDNCIGGEIVVSEGAGTDTGTGTDTGVDTVTGDTERGASTIIGSTPKLFIQKSLSM